MSLRILITGGTGTIGRPLCGALVREGHRLTVLSRRPEAVAALCGPGVTAWGTLDAWTDQERFDAVINLAGEPIADRAWTSRRKTALQESRIGLTTRLVQRMQRLAHPPAVLLSGSAIGYYGAQGEQILNESSPAGDDFSARLCAEWEAAARAAAAFGTRVVLLRTGLVLSRSGGMLERLLPSFRLGLGARLGDGRQWMSWIHIDDHRQLMLKLLHDAAARGAYNLTAPAPVRNADFTRQLAQQLGRPAWAVAPAAVLRPLLGQRADLLLGSQRVVPQRLLAKHETFNHPELAAALGDLLPRPR